MKILKWALIIVAVLALLAVMAAYIFVRNFDVSQYKDRIVTEIATAIDRPVAIADISLDINWKSGVNLGLEGFSVLEKAPSTEKIVAVRSVQLGVDLASLVKERKLVVTLVKLIDPFLHYIQYADATTNIDSLLAAGKDPASKDSPTTAPQAQATSEEDVNLNDLRIASIDVKNAQIILEIRSADSVQALEITQADLSINDFAADREFPIRLAVNAFSNEQNIVLKANCRLDSSEKTIALSGLGSRIALASFDLAKLQKTFPQLKDLDLEAPLAGELMLDIDQVLLSGSGLMNYKGEIRLSDAKLKLGALNFPVENIDALMVLSSPRVDIKDIFMYLGSGEIKGRASLDKALAENIFGAQFNVSSIELGEIIPAIDAKYNVTGKLNGVINASGEHHELNPYTKSLKGDVNFDVTQGKIDDLNILRTVIDKLGFIPNIQQNVNENLPEKYKEMLAREDTLIEALSLNADLLGDQVVIQNVLLQASGFEINSSGKIDFAQNLVLNADLYMQADLAKALLGKESDLTFLLDQKGRLHIPFKPYRGVASKLMMFPDVENLSKMALQNKGKQELRKAIFKALDLEETDAPASDQGSPTKESTPEGSQPQESSPAQEKPEDVLIENVLDAIFK